MISSSYRDRNDFLRYRDYQMGLDMPKQELARLHDRPRPPLLEGRKVSYLGGKAGPVKHQSLLKMAAALKPQKKYPQISA